MYGRLRAIFVMSIFCAFLCFGSAEVFDLDGGYHCFANRQAATLWLNEDEYSLLEHLVEDGEVGVEVSPPAAEDDVELVRLMTVRRRGAV